MKSLFLASIAVLLLCLATPAFSQALGPPGPGCSAIEGIDATSIGHNDFFVGRIGSGGVTGLNKNGKPVDNSDGDSLTDSMEACINDALMGYCTTLFGDDDGHFTITPGATEGNKGQKQWFTATFTGQHQDGNCAVTECSDRADNDPLAQDGTDFPFDPDCDDWDDDSESDTPPVASCNDGTSCTVFTTSGTYTGDLVSEAATLLLGDFTGNGLGAGDAICNYHANDASLPGSYTAWLSDTGTDAKDRIQGSVPYKLIGGTTIANDAADLIGGSLQNAISLDETGSAIGGLVWTGTISTGLKHSIVCSDWTNDGTSGTVQESDGLFGESYQADSRWTIGGGCGASRCDCDNLYRLYCFED